MSLTLLDAVHPTTALLRRARCPPRPRSARVPWVTFVHAENEHSPLGRRRARPPNRPSIPPPHRTDTYSRSRGGPVPPPHLPDVLDAVGVVVASLIVGGTDKVSLFAGAVRVGAEVDGQDFAHLAVSDVVLTCGVETL